MSALCHDGEYNGQGPKWRGNVLYQVQTPIDGRPGEGSAMFNSDRPAGSHFDMLFVCCVTVPAFLIYPDHLHNNRILIRPADWLPVPLYPTVYYKAGQLYLEAQASHRMAAT